LKESLEAMKKEMEHMEEFHFSILFQTATFEMQR
jgi:hypothetical protein